MPAGCPRCWRVVLGSKRVLPIFALRARWDVCNSYAIPTFAEEQHPVEIPAILSPDMLYAVRYRFSNFLMIGFSRLIFALSGHN
jgi:hypothetical protein